MGTRCPLPAANHHGFPPKRKQTKEPRYIKAIVRTSKDLIPPARIPALRKFLGTGIAMIALHLRCRSFGLPDTPPARANLFSSPDDRRGCRPLTRSGRPSALARRQWIAYTVRRVDTKADKNITDLWMASWDGTQDIQLTYEVEHSISNPRWSPDGNIFLFSPSGLGLPTSRAARFGYSTAAAAKRGN